MEITESDVDKAVNFAQKVHDFEPLLGLRSSLLEQRGGKDIFETIDSFLTKPDKGL